MAATGTITIDGEEYTWTSPTLGGLMEFEQTTKLLLSDPDTTNSLRGRAYLAALCLREKQPKITPGVILGWPVSVYPELWTMIVEAIPIFTTSPGRTRPPVIPPAEAGDEKDSTPTSEPSSGSPDGSPAEPETNA